MLDDQRKVLDETFIERLPLVRDVAAKGVQWLVDGLIPEAQICLLTGAFGSGKSMLALALAAAVSEGRAFLGRATTQRRVLILDRENPASTMAERLEIFGIDESKVRIWGGW